MIIGPIAAVSVDAVIGIIAVVVWLILQGAAKRGGSNTPNQPTPPPSPGNAGDPVNPQDDLRRFFEELEKGLSRQAQPPEPPATAPQQPPPIPPVRQRSVTQAHLHREEVSARQPVRAAKPASSPQPATVAPAVRPAAGFTWSPQFPETASAITTLRISDHPEHSDKQRAPSQYRSRKSLRQMIVGAEVLGKPVALRRPGQPLI